ncbi:fatty acyl-CoA hydrolase precursor, medium chain [Anabrus simplex]|uniref:fatty acyl-CoA hydrolase precursor, medium chain n=1 Tax=Anabrus simplex TaxID=316456 RepID=UPI0035A2EB67
MQYDLTMVARVILVLACCVRPGTFGQQWDDLEPLTTSGSLKGRLVDTNFGQVAQFLGVRYAAQPVRFARPSKYEVSDKGRVIDADHFGPSCYQVAHLTDLMYPQLTRYEADRQVSEDCLFLNIYVPALSATQRRAVMVWLPGEGFSFADASQFDGSNLAALGDVIVVTVNYRVGVFGFLSTGNKTAPGNQGVWDVLEALRWVRTNAEAFGGDPARVTLFGRFSGSMIVSLLLTSPEVVQRGSSAQPEPLFSRVILQSGLATGNYVIDNNPANRTNTLAALAGCSGPHPQVMDCLRSVPTDRLDKLSWSVPGLWRPVVDGTLVPSDPLKAVKKGVFNRNVPVVVGETSGEGSLCVLHHFFLETMYASQIMANNISKKEFGQLVREHVIDYLKVQDPSVVDATVHEYRFWPEAGTTLRDQFLKMCGLLYVRVKNEQLARALVKRGTAVWRYEFDHRPSISHHPGFLGAAHGDEVLFVFALLEANSTEPPEMELAQRIVHAWSNFAKTGDPNGGSPGGEWPQFLENSRQMRVFSTKKIGSKTTDFLTRDVDFWGSVVPSLLRNSQRAVVQGRTSGGCGKQKSAAGATVMCSASCPAIIGLVVLSLILGLALLLIGYYFWQITRVSGKGLLAQEHVSQ